LAASTQEQSHLEQALIYAACIDAQIANVTTFGLYRGLAGIMFALDLVIQTSGDRSLQNSLNQAIDRLADSAKPENPGVSWNESNDLFSRTAGIGLALLYLSGQTGRNRLLQLAKAADDHLLAIAHESAEGNYWTSSAAVSTQYPNFSHGTAGIGYFPS
jgi:lantibiotic modifying enzyme